MALMMVVVAQMSHGAFAQVSPINIEPGTSAAQINRLIKKAEPGSKLILRAGTHHLQAPLVIARDDISFVGAGIGKTILKFETENGDFIQVKGGTKGLAIELFVSAREGERTIRLTDVGPFRVGDGIYLQNPNTRSYIARWPNVKWSEAYDRPFRESLHRISGIDGNVITLATPLTFDMPRRSAKAHPVDLVSGVTLTGFTITGHRTTAGLANVFENTDPAFNRAAALRILAGAQNIVRDIEVLDSPSTAVLVQTSTENLLANVHVKGSLNKGGGGNGYGVELRESFDNRLTGLDIQGMRHAVIFSAWHAEARNDIRVAATNRDINFHGSVDRDNRVVVSDIRLAYAPDRSRSKRRNVWPVLSAGGTNHAETDFLATNDVALKTAVGSWRDDTLVAADDAVLEGGFGADRFAVLSSATITDFEPADRLVFKTPVVPFMVKPSGDDLIITTIAGQKVILTGWADRDFNADWIVWSDPKST